MRHGPALVRSFQHPRPGPHHQYLSSTARPLADNDNDNNNIGNDDEDDESLKNDTVEHQDECTTTTTPTEKDGLPTNDRATAADATPLSSSSSSSMSQSSTVTMTPAAASSSSSASSPQSKITPPPSPPTVPGEIYLHAVPDGLRLEYQRPRLVTQVILWLSSLFLSVVSTLRSSLPSWRRVLTIATTCWEWPRLVLAQPTAVLAQAAKHLTHHARNNNNHHQHASWTTMAAWCTAQTVILALALQTVWQDFCLAPSRVSTSRLLRDYYLPSAFSRYHDVVVVVPTPRTNRDENTTRTRTTTRTTVRWKVHYLECSADDENDNAHNNSTATTATTTSAGMIYLNHGFGASSLSWLPAMKALANAPRLPNSVVAHDAPGFGFTARRPTATKDDDGGPLSSWNKEDIELEQYFTSQASAALGHALWHQKTLLYQSEDDDDDDKPNSNNSPPQPVVVLMGHSMGAITTLRMALLLPSTVPKRIVLVAPALGLRGKRRRRRQRQMTTSATTQPRRNSNLFRRANQFLTNRLVDPLATYILRRAVGRPGFWRAGLGVAWGDAQRVTAADVLRFQWPAVGRGWEKGLLLFSRAQLQSSRREDMDDDHVLLQKVLCLPNTTVDVIYGELDPVVKPAVIQRFFQPFNETVQLVEMPGLGHDPFEEDVPAFVEVLQKVLNY